MTDWLKIYNCEEWSAFWESAEVDEIASAIRRQLMATGETDPHTLGKLRGQLEMMTRLKALPHQIAGRQAREQSPAESVRRANSWLDRMKAHQPKVR